jgi:hypothetical protein
MNFVIFSLFRSKFLIEKLGLLYNYRILRFVFHLIDV